MGAADLDDGTEGRTSRSDIHARASCHFDAERPDGSVPWVSIAWVEQGREKIDFATG